MNLIIPYAFFGGVGFCTYGVIGMATGFAVTTVLIFIAALCNFGDPDRPDPAPPA